MTSDKSHKRLVNVWLALSLLRLIYHFDRPTPKRSANHGIARLCGSCLPFVICHRLHVSISCFNSSIVACLCSIQRDVIRIA
jgi:hypothetical protein